MFFHLSFWKLQVGSFSERRFIFSPGSPLKGMARPAPEYIVFKLYLHWACTFIITEVQFTFTEAPYFVLHQCIAFCFGVISEKYIFVFNSDKGQWASQIREGGGPAAQLMRWMISQSFPTSESIIKVIISHMNWNEL